MQTFHFNSFFSEDNKNVKGKVIIKDGYGSGGNGKKSADDKLDEIEKKSGGK